MTLDQLKALDAVVLCGSIRAASQMLHKTPPAISTLIKNLEKDIDIQLLDRDGYRPSLTPEGEIFYAQARNVLSSIDDLRALSQRLEGSRELIVNIAINAVCPLGIILEVLQQIEHKYPQTQVNVSTEQMGGAMERLKREEADIAITTNTGYISSHMEARPLFTIPLFPVVHRDHPLAKFEGLISDQEVKRHSQIIVRDSSRYGETQTLDVIEGGKHSHVTDFAAKKAVIMAGLGWGGMPDYLVNTEIDSGALKPIAVEGFATRHSEQFVIRHTDRVQGIVAREIWDSLCARFCD